MSGASSVSVPTSTETQHIAIGETGLVLHVPPGSIASPITIQVESKTLPDDERTVSDEAFGERTLSDTVLELGPDGTVLAGPVFLEVPVPVPDAFAQTAPGSVQIAALAGYSRPRSGTAWQREDFASTEAKADGVSFLMVDARSGPAKASVFLGFDHFSEHSFVLPALQGQGLGWGELFSLQTLVDGTPMLMPTANFSETVLQNVALGIESVRANRYYSELSELVQQTTRQRAALWGNVESISAALVNQNCPSCTSSERMALLRERITQQIEATQKVLEQLEQANKAVDLLLEYRAHLDQFWTTTDDLLGRVKLAQATDKGAKAEELVQCLAGGALSASLYATLDHALVKGRWDALLPSIQASYLYAHDQAYRDAVGRVDLLLVGDGSIESALSGEAASFLDGTLHSCGELVGKVLTRQIAQALVQALETFLNVDRVAFGAAALEALAVYLVVDYIKHDVVEATENAERLSVLGTMLNWGGLATDDSVGVTHVVNGAATVEVPAMLDAYAPEMAAWHRLGVQSYALENVAKAVADSESLSSSGYVSRAMRGLGDVFATLGGRGVSRDYLLATYRSNADAYSQFLGGLDQAMGACGILPCDALCADADHDGYGTGLACAGPDCDDQDPTRAVDCSDAGGSGSDGSTGLDSGSADGGTDASMGTDAGADATTGSDAGADATTGSGGGDSGTDAATGNDSGGGADTGSDSGADAGVGSDGGGGYSVVNPTTLCNSALCVAACNTPDGCPVCGDGVCYSSESPQTCPEDCAPGCGDGTCSADENDTNCSADCSYCTGTCYAGLNWNCGLWRDFCGQIVSCGTCTGPEVCGGAGQVNRCGVVSGVGSWFYTIADGGYRYWHGTAADNGYLFVTGGISPNLGARSDVEVFPLLPDGRAGAAFPATPLPDVRVGHASFIDSGRLYVVAGSESTSSSPNTLVAPIQADGSLGAWAATTPLPLLLTNPGVALYNRVLYVAGGRNSSTVEQAQVYRATLASDGSLGPWLQSTPLPAARAYFPLVEANGFLFALGGYHFNSGVNGYNDTIYAAAIAGDGSLGAWTQVGTLPQPLADFAAIGAKGNLYVVGGPAQQVWWTTPTGSSLGTWNSAPSFLSTRSGAPVVAYGSFLYLAYGNGYHLGGTPNEVDWAPF